MEPVKAEQSGGVAGMQIYRRSIAASAGTTFFLARTGQGKVLGILGERGEFQGELADAAVTLGGTAGWPWLCPLTPGNAEALRRRLPWLRPQPLGLQTSAGCGDRMGLATPGHLRAVRAVGGIAPILAQQSMRENARTGRSPQQVMDDAMWGVFQEGWTAPWGADADHLKTTADVDLCVAAGYTFFTVDPGDHVDDEAHTAPPDVLTAKLDRLPWAELRWLYLGRKVDGQRRNDLGLEFDEPALARAVAKYGRAIAHTASMYRHLAAAMGSRPFELEVSVDETATPTSPLEHYFVASELQRLGVEWVSLAPRYVGRFEKGVDYVGDLAEFEAEFAKHAAIARALGPYKLSLHSGSDKFSVYPLVARHARELAHLKTAGTSYLEALRTIAGVQPRLFREILAFARARYPEDRLTYHVSADVTRVPPPEQLADRDLAGVLNSFDGREVLHVTFGSVLDRFGADLRVALDTHEEEYYAALEVHFRRHLSPFVARRD